MAIGKQPDASASDDAEEGGDSIFAEINITPLTDVFLVMVIIFMVSALAVQVERNQEVAKKEKEEEVQQRSGLKINLPAGQAQELDPAKASLVLEIPIQGDVVIGGKAMPDGTVDNVFRAAFQRDKNTQVVLKADKGVAHGRVVNLMERAKQAGLTRLAIGTAGGG